MSSKLIVSLLMYYLVILGVTFFEKNYTMVLYWIGAIILTFAMLLLNIKTTGK